MAQHANKAVKRLFKQIEALGFEIIARNSEFSPVSLPA